MYCNRLKTKRELMPGKSGFGSSAQGRHGATSPPGDVEFAGSIAPGYISAQELEQQEAEKKKSQLSAVVVETMTFLGMAQHTDRFLKLLERANMNSIYEVEVLTKETSASLQLPWELVSALQRRLRVWKLEMVDDAEVGLDKGEEYYIKKGLDMPPMDMDPGMQYMPGMMPMPYQNEDQNSKLAEIEELLRQKLKSEETLLTESRSRGDLMDKNVDGMLGRVQTAIESMERRIVSRIDGRPSSGSFDGSNKEAATQRSEVRAFETRITAKLDELHTVAEQQRRHEMHTLETRITSIVQQQMAHLSTKVDVCCQKIESCGQRVDACSQKIDSTGAEQALKLGEASGRISDKIDESGRMSHTGLEALKLKIDGTLSQISGHCQSLLEKVETGNNLTRTGTDSLSLKADALQSSVAKGFTASEESWRQRLGDLEASMASREDEHENNEKRRFDELLRSSSLRRVEELAAQLQKVGERTDQAVAALGTSLASEVQAAANRVSQKAEGVQGAVLRQLADSDASTSRRLDDTTAQVQQAASQIVARIDSVDSATQRRSEASAEAMSQSSHALESAVRSGFESLGSNVQVGTEKAFGKTAAAIEALEKGLAKRLDESIAKCASDAAAASAVNVDRRAEKAIEALEVGHRTELNAAANSILEGISDISSVQARKASERDDRNLRKFEELLEMSASRSVQKTEDVGMEMKKELHGFAKRLNSKIPFM